MRKINVIIVNGKPRSGKDTAIRYIAEYCEGTEIAVCEAHSTIEPVKSLLRKFGWSGDKTDEARNIMAQMKQFWINNSDGPLKHCIDIIIDMAQRDKNNDLVIMFQIREPDEIAKLVNALRPVERAYNLSVSTLFVNRSKADGKAYGNSADTNVADYKYDNIIVNDGTLDELKEVAIKYINELLEVTK